MDGDNSVNRPLAGLGMWIMMSIGRGQDLYVGIGIDRPRTGLGMWIMTSIVMANSQSTNGWSACYIPPTLNT